MAKAVRQTLMGELQHGGTRGAPPGPSRPLAPLPHSASAGPQLHACIFREERVDYFEAYKAFVVPASTSDTLPVAAIGARQSTDFQQGERVTVHYSPRIATLRVRILPPEEVAPSLGAGRWISVGQCRPIFPMHASEDEVRKLLDRAMRGVCSTRPSPGKISPPHTSSPHTQGVYKPNVVGRDKVLPEDRRKRALGKRARGAGREGESHELEDGEVENHSSRAPPAGAPPSGADVAVRYLAPLPTKSIDVGTLCFVLPTPPLSHHAPDPSSAAPSAPALLQRPPDLSPPELPWTEFPVVIRAHETGVPPARGASPKYLLVESTLPGGPPPWRVHKTQALSFYGELAVRWSTYKSQATRAAGAEEASPEKAIVRFRDFRAALIHTLRGEAARVGKSHGLLNQLFAERRGYHLELPSRAEREELVREMGEATDVVPSRDAWEGFVVLAKRPQVALDRPPGRRIGQGERNQAWAARRRLEAALGAALASDAAGGSEGVSAGTAAAADGLGGSATAPP